MYILLIKSIINLKVYFSHQKQTCNLQNFTGYLKLLE